jgi:hypothetical protein
MIYILLKRNTVGLNNDAKVIKSVLKSHKCQIIPKSNLHKIKSQKVSAKIMVESIDPKFIEIESDLSVFVPNPEFLSEWDVKFLPQIDIILCKTRQCHEYFTAIVKKTSGATAKCIYSKFSSPGFVSKKTKNYNLACHFAGTSFMKGTKSLLQTWHGHGGFADGNPDLVLLVTLKCNPFNKSTFAWIKKNCDSYKPTMNLLGYKLKTPVKVYVMRNIYIVDYLPPTAYKYFRGSAGYFICPSEVEGYGHYINEGRIARAITITTDYAPMNELIKNKKSLISVDRECQFGKAYPFVKYLYNPKYPIAKFDTVDFINKFTKLLNMSKDTKDTIGKKNYVEFLKDEKFLGKVFHKIFSKT